MRLWISRSSVQPLSLVRQWNYVVQIISLLVGPTYVRYWHQQISNSGQLFTFLESSSLLHFLHSVSFPSFCIPTQVSTQTRNCIRISIPRYTQVGTYLITYSLFLSYPSDSNLRLGRYLTRQQVGRQYTQLGTYLGILLLPTNTTDPRESNSHLALLECASAAQVRWYLFRYIPTQVGRYLLTFIF